MRTVMRVSLALVIAAVSAAGGCGNPDKIAPDGVVSYNGGAAG